MSDAPTQPIPPLPKQAVELLDTREELLSGQVDHPVLCHPGPIRAMASLVLIHPP
jgi:hypothetical protein